MRILLNVMVMIAGAAIGLAAGFAWHGKSVAKTAPASASTNSTSLAYSRSTASAQRRQVARASDDSPLATQLEQDISMSEGVTRWLYWLDALEKATPADFPRLFQLACNNPTAKKMVTTRWIEVAPRHLFDTILAGSNRLPREELGELGHALFDEWPKRDPDAAIAALNDPAVRAHQGRGWRFTVAYAVVDKDMERGLRLMADWHVDDIGFGTRGLAALSKWTRANPRHAAEFILAQGPSYSVRSTIETIGEEWSKMDPAAALKFATSKSGELASELATSVLKKWANRNPQQAADWLATTDDQTRSHLSSSFVEGWANKDAKTALAWCEENLTGTMLAKSIAAVLRSAAEKDVVAASALVDQMDPSRSRSEAAVAVAQKWLPNLASGKEVPPEAIAWLTRLDSDSIKRVLDRTTWGWATSDPRSMAAFLTSQSADQVPPYSYSIVARELARKNPMEALEWAGQLPEHEALAAGGDAFTEWRGSQPEAAMKWLNDLAPDDARRQPYFKSAMQVLAYHAQAADQIAAMSPAERAAARNVIATMDLQEERRTRLLELLKP